MKTNFKQPFDPEYKDLKISIAIPTDKDSHFDLIFNTFLKKKEVSPYTKGDNYYNNSHVSNKIDP